jgi:uncharacterized membrane protein YGL010W
VKIQLEGLEETAMALMSDRTHEEWLAQYELSHQHPMNRRCHTLGIPLIVLSLVAVIPAIWVPALRWVAGTLFVVGWALQFIGHAYERKPPEFMRDWRFLFVGVRWWLWKMRSSSRAPEPQLRGKGGE